MTEIKNDEQLHPFLSTHEDMNVPKPGTIAFIINKIKAVDSETSTIASSQLPKGV